jgi:hypothetical protein
MPDELVYPIARKLTNRMEPSISNPEEETDFSAVGGQIDDYPRR